MKQKLVVFLGLLVLFFVVLAGCNLRPRPKDYNALANWTDGGDEVYTITENTDLVLAFSYAKGDKPNAYVTSPVITKDLSNYKTLVISLEGAGSVMIELVAQDGTSIKVSLNVPAYTGTYQWNLINETDILDNLSTIRITGAPGKESSIGNVNITSLLFKQEVATDYIIQTDYNDIVELVHEYNGEAGDWHFNSKWHLGAEEEIYTIQEEETKTVVNVEKSVGGEWAYVMTRIKGDFSDFNYVVVKVKGEADKKILLKIRDNPQAEQLFTFTGQEQTIYYDFSGWTDNEKKALDRVMLFVLPGASSGTTSLDILDIYLTDSYETGIVKNEYNGVDEEFSISHYYDNGDKVYDVSTSGEDSIISYVKTENTYPVLISHIVGDVSHFDYLEVVASGLSGKSILVKLEGVGKNYESEFIFDGSRQTFGLNLFGNLTVEQRKGINRVIIFAEPGVANVSGEFTLHSVTFKMNSLGINDKYIDNDEIYEMVDNPDQSVTVTYNKANFSYGSFYRDIEANTFNALLVTLKGEAGTKVLLKINDSKETMVELKGDEEVTTILTLEQLGLEVFTQLRFFGAPGVENVQGSFTIVKAELINKEATAVPGDVVVDVNNNWVDKDNINAYTFEYVDGKVVVTYNKPAGSAWSAIYNEFTENLANHKILTMTVKGTDGVKAIFKINNMVEEKITFNGEEQTFSLTFPSTPTDIHIFVEYEASEAVSGTFEILNAKVISEEEPIVPVYVDGGDNAYTITVNEDYTVTIDYNKPAGFEWSSLYRDLTNIEFNTMKVTLKGPQGKQVLVKVNDSKELFVDLNGDVEVTAEFNLDLLGLTEFTELRLFAEPGTSGVEGTFTIVSVEFFNTEIPPVPADVVVDVNNNWVDKDNINAYTFEYVDEKVVVTYNKPAGSAWSAIYNEFTENLANHKILTMTVKGTDGVKAIFKINNMVEEKITFNGEEQTFSLTFPSTPTDILIFVEYEASEAVSGSFEISSAVLTS